MLAIADGPERARWEVLWVEEGKIQKESFENDLMGAVTAYAEVKAEGLAGSTLRCTNMGFPPPAELLPRVVRGRHPTTRKIVEGTVVPMKKKNAEGIYWCPYCMQLRKFKMFKRLKVENIVMDDRHNRCPMCKAGLRDHNVRKWNPLAAQVHYSEEASRTRAPARTTQARKAAFRRKKRRAKTEE